MTDETIKLSLETDIPQKAKDAAAAMDLLARAADVAADETRDQETAISGLVAELIRDRTATYELASATQVLSGNSKETYQVILNETRAVEANTKAKATSAAATTQLTSGTQSSALGFLYLSQAIEDAQYGFSAIVNNIPMIVMAMGGGPGLAGALSIAAVAMNQLMWAMASAASESSVFLNRMDALSERIREIESKPVKLAVDVLELQNARTEMEALRRAKGRLDAIMGKQSEAEKLSGQAVEGVMEGPEGRAAADRGRQELLRRSLAQGKVPELEAEVAAAEKHQERMQRLAEQGLDTTNQLGRAEERLKNAREAARMARLQAEQNARDQYDQILTEATTGVGGKQRQAQEQLATLIGGPEAERIRAARPETQEWFLEAEAQSEMDQEGIKKKQQAERERNERNKKNQDEHMRRQGERDRIIQEQKDAEFGVLEEQSAADEERIKKRKQKREREREAREENAKRERDAALNIVEKQYGPLVAQQLGQLRRQGVGEDRAKEIMQYRLRDELMRQGLASNTLSAGTMAMQVVDDANTKATQDNTKEIVRFNNRLEKGIRARVGK